MFPRDFEHDGEHHIEPMPHGTWYEEHLRPKRAHTGSMLPTTVVPMPESWAVGLVTLNVTAMKEKLRASPRLPAFVFLDLFEDDPISEAYLVTIYAHREDEWPWVRLDVPAIVANYRGRYVLMDGNHRYAKAKRLGRPYFLAYLLTLEETESVSNGAYLE